MPYSERLKIFCGNAHPALARNIADCLESPLSKLSITRLKDSETYVTINENVRGVDVFVVQPICRPVNEHFVELAIIIDALKRASAARVTAVIPYFGYARQDRKARGREPITAKLIANMLVSAGLDRVLTIDLHSDQIQGFFDIPLDHLTATTLFANHIRSKSYPHPVIVSPDLGSVKKVRKIADQIEAPFAILDKVRKGPDEISKVSLLGKIHGKTIIIIDDIIDTGETIFYAINALRDKGAQKILVCATHPVFSAPAPENLLRLGIEEMIVTDTIPLLSEYSSLRSISIAPLLAKAIANIHRNESVSALFQYP